MMAFKSISSLRGTLTSLFIISLLFSLGMACISGYDDDQMVVTSGNYSYSLAEPDERFELPGRLEEISGLDYLGDGILLCVEDENGIVYFYNIREKEITRQLKFEGSGDYEGIAHIGNTIYVVRSDGLLYRFPVDGNDNPEPDKIRTPLKASNNVEGLAATGNRNELLLACKDNPEVEDNQVEGRAVYSFDLRKKKLDTDPVVNLTSESFREALKKLDLKPAQFMPFKPSGIAIHPESEDIFIIGSVGTLLVVLDRSGKILDASPLSRRIFAQPEGICFDESGNLYISSEGRGKDGYILVFRPENKN